MALRRFDGTVQYAVDDATGEMHIVSVAGDGTATDIVTLATPVSGVTFDADVDIGDVHLLDTAGSKVDPATAAKQDAGNASLAAIDASLVGTGLPIPLALSDPGDNDWSDALDPNPVSRACKRLRCFVGNSGVQISLDGGTTAHVSLPADYADDLAIAIPQGADVRVKRLTADTAITELIVEVR